MSPILAVSSGAPKSGGSDDRAIRVQIRQARKTYGKLAALDGVDVAIQAGTIHGLVGPNGSGKTTLLNVISGLIRLDSGSVAIAGREVGSLPAYAIARLGVGRTFQTPRVFEDMSIWDNLRLGADFRDTGDANWLLAAFRETSEAWESERPDLLPHAQRRLLEIMRVIAMDVDLLLLDEPAAGLSPGERRAFARLLRELRDRWGKTIILVEHDLALVWRVADRISVLDAGAIVAEGPPDAIVGDARVRALFTGSGHA